jgi:hypothetical protein
MNIKDYKTSIAKTITSIALLWLAFWSPLGCSRAILPQPMRVEQRQLNGGIKLDNPRSVSDLLDDYGFGQSGQKEALEFLMQQVGILKDKLIDFFPKRDNTDDLFKDIVAFVDKTQVYFVKRTGIQERWDVKSEDQKLSENEHKEMLAALNRLGIIKEKMPTSAEADILCVLGATMPAMEYRLEYAKKLLLDVGLNVKYLVLAAGARPAIDRDAPKK